VVVAERAAAALGQVEQAAPLAPLAPLAARGAARAATALFNPLMAKAVRLEILLLNLPVARARIASIPQGRELDREALVRALKLQRENVMRERAASGRRFANACPHAQRRSQNWMRPLCAALRPSLLPAGIVEHATARGVEGLTPPFASTGEQQCQK
jgi:hypothetical protein